jgi:hypothetical protein
MPSFCPQCGTTLQPDTKFCEECGASVGGITAKPVSCSTRGAGSRIWLWVVVGCGAVLLIAGGLIFALQEWGDPDKRANQLFVFQQLQSNDLLCSEAVRLVVEDGTLTYNRKTIFGSNFQQNFRIVSAQCEAVATEGKRAKAILTVKVTIQDVGFGTGGINIFGKNEDVPTGTPFELEIEGHFLLYDVGWRFESFTSKSGRRLQSSNPKQHSANTDTDLQGANKLRKVTIQQSETTQREYATHFATARHSCGPSRDEPLTGRPKPLERARS